MEKQFFDALSKGDKVYIVYGDNEESFEGYVDSISDKHLVIHEYVPDIYRTLRREGIVEISKA